MSLRPLLAIALALAALASPTPAVPQVVDVLDALAATPGVLSVEEAPSRYPGTRFFVLAFDQPVDHRAPSGARFAQRATLLFQSFEAPMVLASTGYGISTRPSRAEPTFLLGANQLLVEHRFFGPSAPEPLDWRKLDLFQAASDHHRLVGALRPLFPARWLSTGASKGGMTSVYHRVLFPRDVDATLAYVAPQTYGRSDPRYARFIEQRGDPACREAIHAFQRALVRERAAITARFVDDAAAFGEAFTLIPVDRAFEYAMLESSFAFWQYGDASLCPLVPAPEASADELYAFLDALYGGVAFFYADSSSTFFAPYYYQSATELGGPAYPQAHLLDLFGGPIRDLPQDYPPLDVAKPWNPLAMPLVQLALLFRGERVMFVYGENDPWSAGAFVPCGRECPMYVVPGGNHGSRLTLLPEAQQAEAVETLARWRGVTPPAAAPAAVRAALSAAAPDFDGDALLVRRPGR